MSAVDVIKLPLKLLVPLLLAAVATLVAIAYKTSTDGPFMFYGQEFGYTTKLKDQIETARANAVTAQGLVMQYSKELKASQDEVAALKQKIADFEKQSTAVWYPIADVRFSLDGTFTVAGSDSEFRGFWRSKESEISLRLVSLDGDEAVFETNLDQPRNRLRIAKGHSIWMPFQQYDYTLAVRDVSYRSGEPVVNLRIDRQPKRR
ncbi:hypothetical protein SAMN05428960_0319 [Mitsuaria sp. PDC51]|uniref:hypothetical protein n=1 Tax=Mitsuaria sp. PDC51 TaxID=1881035 RepID=UPI0008F0178E|nr:hypothetical protein [Mitsuaria sp. PDC51]SFR71079.1 hypothetical protein SAMN05428960_0319 [Mitsuaria sp. PDC51]